MTTLKSEPGLPPPTSQARRPGDPGGAGVADAGAGLEFPDVPRLELDQLLEQLVERADDVRAAQGRLRGLLRANALVASDLRLPVVLRHIVTAARELLGARYAALGVLDREGGLEQFVHAGMDDALVGKVGGLPQGRGILGLLISEPVPIRLTDLAAHPASSGFPPGHPPMTSFVGVPIRIGEEVFGNLYLTERARGGEFTAEDEELAIALAAAAGAAIANARRFAESEQRRRWLAASAELTPVLLSGAPTPPPTLITQHAAAAAAADFALLWGYHETDQAVVTGVSGALAMNLMNRAAPLADSPAGEAILTGKPSLVTDGRRAAAGAWLDADIGPLIVVPLAAGGRIRGALMLGRLATAPEFTETDLDMAASFASHATVALELAQARVDQIALAQVEDHDRIAAELHGHVIQELFALGMKLQGDASRSDPLTAHRITSYVGALDEIICKIRSSIFGLRQAGAVPGSLQTRLLEIINEHAPQLGFTAHLRFAGPPELTVDAALTYDILAVTRETLSNCARHAHASAISISLDLRDGLIILDIADNGRGLGTPTRSSGLTNMRQRAERNGGTLTIGASCGGGTRLTWTGLQYPDHFPSP